VHLLGRDAEWLEEMVREAAGEIPPPPC